MKNKFTPGPWETNALYSQVHSKDNKIQICLVSVNENIPDDQFTYEEWRANAALIASAPDLLEALEEAIKHVDSHFYPKEKKQCEDAIKKARGL